MARAYKEERGNREGKGEKRTTGPEGRKEGRKEGVDAVVAGGRERGKAVNFHFKLQDAEKEEKGGETAVGRTWK